MTGSALAEALIRVKRYFEKWREEIPELHTEEDRRLLKQALRNRSSLKILDVGCGYGRIMRVICSETGFYVVGLDIAENLLRQAKTISDVVLGSLTHLPFRDRAFDVCLCIYGPLNHVPSLVKGLREVKRVCRWRVIATLYNKFSQYWLCRPKEVLYSLLNWMKRRLGIGKKKRRGLFIKPYHIKEILRAFRTCGLKIRFWRGQMLGKFKLHTHAKLLAVVADVPSAHEDRS